MQALMREAPYRVGPIALRSEPSSKLSGQTQVHVDNRSRSQSLATGIQIGGVGHIATITNDPDSRRNCPREP